jgi:transposase
MNRTDNQTRKVFQRMNKAGSSAMAISAAIGKNIQTIYNLRKISDDKLLLEPNKSTRKPSFDVAALKKYITDNPFAFNKEIGLVFGKSKNTIQKWRHRLGFRRKKAKTTYKEADKELKKTLNH